MPDGGMPDFGDGKSPDNWNSDLTTHGVRDGVGEYFTADELMTLPKDKFAPSVVNDMHRYSDLDVSTLSQHHTLGLKHNQAAPGDHTHDGGSSKNLGKWVDISPVSGLGGLWIASSGAQPALGSGKIWAKYLKLGTTVWYKLGVTGGTGMTFGGAFWEFLLPTQAVTPPVGANAQSNVMGSAYGFQGGSSNYTGTASLFDSTHIIIASHLNGNAWGPTVPVTWTATNTNYWGFSVVYESVS